MNEEIAKLVLFDRIFEYSDKLVPILKEAKKVFIDMKNTIDIINKDFRFKGGLRC